MPRQCADSQPEKKDAVGLTLTRCYIENPFPQKKKRSPANDKSSDGPTPKSSR
jgi:hypothetical protein